jgi:hypothetical protein
MDEVSDPQDKCDHNMQFLRTAKWENLGQGYNIEYNRVDTFYCTKCLYHERVVYQESRRQEPDWYKGK